MSAKSCSALKIRVVHVVELMTLQPETEHPHGLPDAGYKYVLPLSACLVSKRFGTWKKAPKAASEAWDLKMPGQPEKTARRRNAIGPRTRFIVFKRDLYRHQICRKSGVEPEPIT